MKSLGGNESTKLGTWRVPIKRLNNLMKILPRERENVMRNLPSLVKATKMRVTAFRIDPAGIDTRGGKRGPEA